jgi:hypothetical protein
MANYLPNPGVCHTLHYYMLGAFLYSRALDIQIAQDRSLNQIRKVYPAQIAFPSHPNTKIDTNIKILSYHTYQRS